MDLERIFTLIVILVIWVASNAIRKIARPEQKDQADTEQKPGFFEIIQQNFAALEERNKGEESVELDEYFQPHTQPHHDPETLIEMAEDAMQQREAVPAPAPPKAVKPQATIIQKKPGMTKRRKLQNAIIWAEILAPPVALRDQ
jgi:hypothetical protein